MSINFRKRVKCFEAKKAINHELQARGYGGGEEENEEDDDGHVGSGGHE